MIKSTNQKAVRTEQQVVWQTDNRSVQNSLNETIPSRIPDDRDDPAEIDGVPKMDDLSWRSLQFIVTTW